MVISIQFKESVMCCVSCVCCLLLSLCLLCLGLLCLCLLCLCLLILYGVSIVACASLLCLCCLLCLCFFLVLCCVLCLCCTYLSLVSLACNIGLGRISVLTDIRPPDSAFSSFNGYPISVVFFDGYPYGYPLSVFYYYPSGYPTDSAFFVEK